MTLDSGVDRRKDKDRQCPLRVLLCAQLPSSSDHLLLAGLLTLSTLAGNLNFLLSQEGRGSDLVRPGPTGPTS